MLRHSNGENFGDVSRSNPLFDQQQQQGDGDYFDVEASVGLFVEDSYFDVAAPAEGDDNDGDEAYMAVARTTGASMGRP